LNENEVTLEEVKRSIEVLIKAGSSLLAMPVESALKMFPGGSEAFLHLVDLKISLLKSLKSVVEGEISY